MKHFLIQPKHKSRIECEFFHDPELFCTDPTGIKLKLSNSFTVNARTQFC
jgi:hypothetical protein